MKFTAIFILVAFLQVHAKGFSQQLTFSEKKAPLQRVLKRIESQTSYVFFYEKGVLKNAKPVTIQVQNATLEEVLDLCFRNQPLTYSIVGTTIVIKQKPSTTSVFQPADNPLSLHSPIDIHGRIVNEKGEPVIASVQVKGTNKGTSTNDNGEFELKNVNDHTILIISGVSIETFEVNVNGRSELALKAKVRVENLNEVVINKGYYSVRQRENTGDVTKVSGEDIRKQPVTDPLAALQGRVSGLYISQGSGLPGANFAVRLRGQNSISNGNDPLYIVDGVPFSSDYLTSIFGGGGGVNASPLNNLNASDIESIEVLKDADATAIYGSRGANGVILITTKKGKAGKIKFDVNVYSGYGKVTRMLKLMNTQQYLQMRHEAFLNDGAALGPTDYDINGTWDTTRYTDWQKFFIGGTSRITDLESSVSSGNENTQFLLAGNYRKETTVYPGDFSSRKGSFHFNMNHESVNKKFSLSISTSYVTIITLLPTFDAFSKITLAPDAPQPYDASGNINWQSFPNYRNPVAQLQNTNQTRNDNLLSSVNLGYKICQSVQAKVNLGYNEIHENEIIKYPLSALNSAYSNFPTYYISSAQYASTNIKNWIIEPQINYHIRIFRGYFEALIGNTFQQYLTNKLAQSGKGYSQDALLDDIAAASTVTVNSADMTQYRNTSTFLRLNYNWNEKYLFNVTARSDGSSRFGPGKQFGNFGAAGIGWIFTQEKFVQQKLHFLSFGKIRGSYGITGNDQIGDYQYLSTYTPYPYSYQGTAGLYPTGLTNPYYSWETVNKFELGLELGLIKDRVFLNFDYYRNRTRNQLVGYSLPTITGFSSIQANLPAIVHNSGYEFEINSTNLKRKNISWSSSFNLTIPKNKLVAYPNIEGSSYANTYVVGKSLFIRKAYHVTGVDPLTGILSFQDVDHDGNITYPNDYIGYKEIKQSLFGGLENSVNYKSLRIDFLFQFVKQTGANYLALFGSPPGARFANQSIYVLDRWQKPGDITPTQKFTQSFGPVMSAYTDMQVFSDYIIADASFIRLKNLSISYQLPKKWQQAMHLQNGRIYMEGQNLFTITKYIGLDPENGTGSLPPLKTLAFGIQVTF